jgi:predicted O-linked N-acetylglucosamine transferase (SPINDLY family)
LEEQVPAAVHTQRSGQRRLRIGYVSPDFREHSVMFFIEPILARHDRQAFEVFCYANQPIADVVTTRLRSQADHWRDIYRMSDAETQELIRRDEIDILVDLAVHTQGNRLSLFARKPAPLQGTYLGYASTTGLSRIDFRITDPWVDPPNLTDAFHSEKLMRLPRTQWVYRPLADTPEVSPLPALHKGRLTFGVATNLAKISAPTIEMWAAALRAVGDATLVVKGTGMEDEATRQYFLDRFAQAGITADGLRLEPSSPLAEYLQWFSEVDLILDTFPFAGGTTSCHALYMGAPVVTGVGNTSVSRVGSSLLHNLGLAELIAETPQQFADIVRQLSADLPRLASLRESLRPRMQRSPLTDEARFVGDLESAYQRAWAQRWPKPSAESK